MFTWSGRSAATEASTVLHQAAHHETVYAGLRSVLEAERGGGQYSGRSRTQSRYSGELSQERCQVDSAHTISPVCRLQARASAMLRL